MRYLAGLLLALALSGAIVAAGFGIFNVYRHRRRASLLWAVAAVTLFVGQCGFGQLTAASKPSAGQQVAVKPSASPTHPATQINSGPSPSFPAQPGVTRLPVAGFGRMVVDGTTSHVFVSSPRSSAIVVLDFSGNIVSTITDEPGADAMVVIGSALYVTLTTAGAIDEIDTGKLSRIRTLRSGLVSPADLVAAAGRLWTTTGPCANWSTELVSVDPNGGTSKTFKLPADSSLSYCAAFAANDPTADRILAWDKGLEPATVSVIDVSTGTPVFAQSAREDRLGNLKDVALTRDGMRFITASGAPYEFDEWRMTSLAQDGVIYPAGPYPVAVAVSHSGRETMAGGLWQPYGQDVYEYAVGWPSSALQGRHTGTTSSLVYDRGLAFSVDGSSIFVLTGDQQPGSDGVTFNVIPAA
jgi:hypothetical protein